MTPEKLGKAAVRRWGACLPPAQRAPSSPPSPTCHSFKLPSSGPQAFGRLALPLVHLRLSAESPVSCVLLSNPIVPLSPFKMTRQSLSRAAGIVGRNVRTSTTRAALFAPRRAVAVPTTRALCVPFTTTSRFLSTTPSRTKGILPDSDDPAPPNVQDDGVKAIPANLTDAEYHEVSDTYLEVILSELETLADKNESIEVEYSVGAPHPSLNNNTFTPLSHNPPFSNIDRLF